MSGLVQPIGLLWAGLALGALGVTVFAWSGAWSGAGRGSGVGVVERGKPIFEQGISTSGKDLSVTMQLFGGAERTVSAKRYACINCHTADGEQSIEGGIVVPSIQLFALRSPTHPGNGTGRVRVAYDETTLRRAITMGVDASGNRLDPLMPRFNLSDQDLADLLAYLGELGSGAVPGVTKDAVRVVSVVDADRFTPAAGAAVHDTLKAFVAETNARGGVYGRSIRLDVLTPTEWRDLAKDGRRAGEYLCAVAPLGLPGDASVKLPVCGVLEPDPLVPPRYIDGVFHLYPSQLDQVRVAVDHYCDVLKNQAARFRLLLEPGVDPRPFRAALSRQAELYPGSDVSCAGIDADDPVPSGSVLLLVGSPSFKQKVLTAAKLLDGAVAVYSTHLLPPGLVQAMDQRALDKLRLLLPIPLPDAQGQAVAGFRAFLSRHHLAESQVSHRIAAFAAAASFVEALKRCGARVTRRKFSREVRALYKFQPGLYPPITFGPNRNTGATGAQVVRYESKGRSLVALSAWSEPR